MVLIRHWFIMLATAAAVSACGGDGGATDGRGGARADRGGEGARTDRDGGGARTEGGGGQSDGAVAPPPRRRAVFVAPRGSDANPCTRAAPCAGFNRAYRAARPGGVVEVAGGNYPSQRIVADPRKTSRAHVVFRPTVGALVTLGGLTLGSGQRGDGPRHLTIRDMRTIFTTPTQQRPVSALPGTRDVVWENLDAGNFTLWGVRDFTVRGGDWGPCHTGPGVECSNARIDAGPVGYPTVNVVVEDALFHDYRFGPGCWAGGADCHFECMFVNGSQNVTIRGSRFRDCALYDIFVTISGPDAARVGHRNLTIENNWFDTPWDESGPGGGARARASALALNWCQNSALGYRDVLIRFNSFQRNTGMLLDPNPRCVFENVRVVGNLLMFDGCDTRWTYAFNLWSTAWRRGRCSSTDQVVGDSFPYASAASGGRFDFHLRSGRRTAADAAVPQSVAGGCPSRDVDGEQRPLDGRCNAGADQRRVPQFRR